jgi:hypothetical protein
MSRTSATSQGIFFLYIMKTSSLSRPSRNFSSDVKESRTQLTNMAQGQQGQAQEEEDPMVERYSWYYEEQESSRFEDRPSVDDRISDRPSSIATLTRMLSMKDSLLYRESAA